MLPADIYKNVNKVDVYFSTERITGFVFFMNQISVAKAGKLNQYKESVMISEKEHVLGFRATIKNTFLCNFQLLIVKRH